jgi:hypothetical protein
VSTRQDHTLIHGYTSVNADVEPMWKVSPSKEALACMVLTMNLSYHLKPSKKNTLQVLGTLYGTKLDSLLAQMKANRYSFIANCDLPRAQESLHLLY